MKHLIFKLQKTSSRIEKSHFVKKTLLLCFSFTLTLLPHSQYFCHQICVFHTSSNLQHQLGVLQFNSMLIVISQCSPHSLRAQSHETAPHLRHQLQRTESLRQCEKEEEGEFRSPGYPQLPFDLLSNQWPLLGFGHFLEWFTELRDTLNVHHFVIWCHIGCHTGYRWTSRWSSI